MALKSDDILLVQRGDQSYKMPASQLVTSGEVAPNLQTVTDSGNTTTNGATFGNTVTSPDYNSNSASGKGFYIDPNGLIVAQKESNKGTQALWQGRLGDADPTSEIFADGSGIFAGDVEVTDVGVSTGSNTSSWGVAISPNSGQSGGQSYGNIVIQGDSRATGTNNTFSVFSGNTNTASIALNGSAMFAEGDSTLNKVADGAAFNVRNNSSTQAIGVYAADFTSGERVIALNGDGSGVFDGDVQIGDDPTSAVTNKGVMVRSGGRIIARSENDNDNVWSGGTNGTNDTSMIKASGAATFATGNDTFDASGKLTIKRTDGDTNAVLVLTDGSDAAQTVFYGNGQVTFVATNIQFYTGGSATFAGNVAVGGSVGDHTVTGVHLNKDGKVATTGSGTSNLWNGYQKDTAGQTSVIAADGQAIFNARVSGSVTNIDSTGAFDLKDSNFWTVAGPTLSNPTSVTAGQSGVMYCTGEVNSFGNKFSFSGGSTPTIPANSVVPYYVDTADKIRLGIATEAFV